MSDHLNRPGPSALSVIRAAQLTGLPAGLIMDEVRSGRLHATRFPAGMFISEALLPQLRALAAERRKERSTVTLRITKAGVPGKSILSPEVPTMDRRQTQSQVRPADPAALADLGKLCEGRDGRMRKAIGLGFEQLISSGKSAASAVEVLRQALAYADDPAAVLEKEARRIVAMLPRDDAPPVLSAEDQQAHDIVSRLPAV